MYCTQCGQQIKESDNFCFNCGSSNTRRTLTDIAPGMKPGSVKGKARPYITQTAKEDVPLDPRIKLVLLLVLLVLIAPIALLFIFPPEQSEANAIRIETLPSASWEVQSCEDCKIVKVDGHSFPLEKGVQDSTSLKKYLINLAQNYDGQKSATLALFDETKRNRYFDVSFDISGSVVELDNIGEARGAEIKYSDEVFEKVKQYLKQELSPGDTIKVRLYGPAQRDNPCKGTLTLQYAEPEWEADFIYSVRRQIAVIKIGKLLPPNTTRDGAEITTNSLNVIFENMHRFYGEALSSENRWCHTDTFLDQHLIRILDDVEKRYTNHHYILTNDGEFSFSNTYITDREYALLGQYTSGGQSFLTENVLCSGTGDTFTLIGMDYKGSLSYRQAVEDFFNKILVPCQVTFKNL